MLYFLNKKDVQNIYRVFPTLLLIFCKFQNVPDLRSTVNANVVIHCDSYYDGIY